MSINSKMTAIADEIRGLYNTTEKVGLDDISNTLKTANEDISTETELIEQLKNSIIGNIDQLIERDTLICYSNSNVTKIRDYAFQYCINLESVDFPASTKIGSSAFCRCYRLNSISFPECTTIGSYAFFNCSSLTTASFPACTSIGTSAFYSCTGLTTASFPVCTSINSCTFGYCTSLTTANFPECTSIGSSAFRCCHSLTTASFPSCNTIYSAIFSQCYMLSSLTLGASTVCTLVNSNAFSSTPYAGYSVYYSGTPYIYVPASLVSSYQTATNWTYFSSYFSAIPVSIITFTIDGISYQAEEGMTWREWINSDYNTDGYDYDPIGNITDGNYTETVYLPDYSPVTISDTIIENMDYIL